MIFVLMIPECIHTWGQRLSPVRVYQCTFDTGANRVLMTYSLFLLIFLVTPIVALGWMMRSHLTRRHAKWLALLMAVALVYTTAWDNYLVASRVWWYDPNLVMGITIGWVPLEEYTFFLLQPLMTGLWVLYLNRHLPLAAATTGSHRLRVIVTMGAGLIWLGALYVLAGGWLPGNYLALILVWALPPIALQTAFGADILWHERQRVLLSLLPVVIYLSLADALAIGLGTWTINPERSLEIYLGSVLPVEEFVFFLVTNVLIVFSFVLLLSRQSYARLNGKVSKYLRLPTLPNNRPIAASRR